LKYFQDAVDSTPPDLARRLHGLALSYTDCFQRQDNLDELDSALKYFQDAVDSTPPPDLADCLHGYLVQSMSGHDDSPPSSNNLLSPLPRLIVREIRVEGPSERLFHSAPSSMTQSRTSVPPDALYSLLTEGMLAFLNESLFRDGNPTDGSTVPDQSDISPLPNIGLCSRRRRIGARFRGSSDSRNYSPCRRLSDLGRREQARLASEAVSKCLSDLDRRMEADYVGRLRWRLSDAVIFSETIVTRSHSRLKQWVLFASTIPGREAAFTTDHNLKSMSSISVFL